MLDETKQIELANIRVRGSKESEELIKIRREIESQKAILHQINSSNSRKIEREEKDYRENWKNTIDEKMKAWGVKRWGVAPVPKRYMFTNASLNPLETRAVVIIVPMRYEEMKTAPSLRSLTEIMRAYAETGKYVIMLTEFLKKNGFHATGHHPLGDKKEYHHVLMPPLAHAAGLGEKGRTGLFIDHELGPLVRIGIVTTDMPLPFGSPVDKGITAFCHRCKLCAVRCPVQALPTEGALEQYKRGIKINFKVNGDRCIKYFSKHYGCGKCISECLLAQPSIEEVKKRIERIETWYHRWILSGELQKMLEAELPLESQT